MKFGVKRRYTATTGSEERRLRQAAKTGSEDKQRRQAAKTGGEDKQRRQAAKTGSEDRGQKGLIPPDNVDCHTVMVRWWQSQVTFFPY